MVRKAGREEIGRGGWSCRKNLRARRGRFAVPPPLHPATNSPRHCCNTMDSLATELLETISSYVVPQPSRDETRIPLSTTEERRDVNNFRLICHVLRNTSTKAFATLIGKAPFYCTQKSMNNLSHYVLFTWSSKCPCSTMHIATG
jgi:hypothetical protein